MFLSDEFVERAWAHPGGERSRSADAFLHFAFGLLKQILHDVKNTKRERPRTLYSRACERRLRFCYLSRARSACQARPVNCLSAPVSKGAIALTPWWRARNRQTGRHYRAAK